MTSNPSSSLVNADLRSMDVWRIDLAHAGTLGALFDVLDEREKSRAGRFRFEELFRRFVVAHGAVRFILSSYSGISAADLIFEHNAFGKPCLANCGGPTFSLSHSDETALCGVASAGEIGVDIERCRDIQSLEMAHRFFSGTEYALLESMASEQKRDGFFACWTRKEAYIKAKGLGLSLPLGEFSVEFGPDLPASLTANHYAPEDVGRFRLWDLPVADGYKAALAYCGVEAGPPNWRQWSFSKSALAAR